MEKLLIETRSFLLAIVVSLGGCAAAPFTPSDDNQPEITVTAPNDHVVYHSGAALKKLDFAPMASSIPAYNGKGKLFASWNPHPNGVAGRPTLVIMHGGLGLTGPNFMNGKWARDQLGANVLFLDSYWSRGLVDNLKTETRFGANMRMLDAIAAGRWLKVQGADPRKTYILGDSQGGWSVLRTFTDEKFMRDEVDGLYAGGVALYPNCMHLARTEYFPKLGPYIKPILIITGGADNVTGVRYCIGESLKTPNAKWIQFPDATHSFDMSSPFRNLPDGFCVPAANGVDKNCRNEADLAEMQRLIKEYVNSPKQ